MLVGLSSPFGSITRTRVLTAMCLLGATYPRELARILGVALNGVQGALRSLERDGLVSGRPAGRTRLFELNPRYFAANEVRALAARLGAVDDDLQDRVAALRRRPRRTAKPL